MPKRRRSLPRGLYRRGKTLYARIQIAGQDIRRCLHTDDVGTARARLKAERDRLNAELRYGGDARRWEDVVLAWGQHIRNAVAPRTAARYAMSLDQLRPWLTGRALHEINKSLVGEIVEARRRSGASAATIRRDLTALSSLLQFAEARGWHEGNAALAWFRLTRERRDPIILPDTADVEAVIAASGPMSTLIRAALATGARQDELVRADRRDLEAARRTLTIRGKGGKIRTIDVSGCWELFATLPAGIAGAALFACPSTGGRWKNVASRFAGVTRRVATAARKAGRPFQRFRFHDLRHLHAVEWMRAGGSIYELQARLGHGSVKTTEIYLAYLGPEERERAKAGTKTGTKRI